MNERDRNRVLQSMERKVERAEMERLREDLSALDRMDLVLRYRMREKGYLSTCTQIEIAPTHQYLQAIMRKMGRQYRPKTTLNEVSPTPTHPHPRPRPQRRTV